MQLDISRTWIFCPCNDKKKKWASVYAFNFILILKSTLNLIVLSFKVRTPSCCRGCYSHLGWRNQWEQNNLRLHHSYWPSRSIYSFCGNILKISTYLFSDLAQAFLIRISRWKIIKWIKMKRYRHFVHDIFNF